MEFHKHAYEILSELLPVIEGLQEEQEVRCYDPKQSTRTDDYSHRLLIVRIAAPLRTTAGPAEPESVACTELARLPCLTTMSKAYSSPKYVRQSHDCAGVGHMVQASNIME